MSLLNNLWILLGVALAGGLSLVLAFMKGKTSERKKIESQANEEILEDIKKDQKNEEVADSKSDAELREWLRNNQR